MSPLAQFRPDPGGRFASDEHRRILAHLPVPPEIHENDTATIVAEAERRGLIGTDERLPDELPVSRTLDSLLKRLRDVDLAQTGHVTLEDIGEILKDLEADGYVTLTGDEASMTRKGYETLTSGQSDEPAPLEGKRLEAAKLQDEALAEADKERLGAEPEPPNFDPEA